MTPTELEAQLRWLHKESWGWALQCCGRVEPDAEDVLQTAYLKVVSGSARFAGRSAFKTWLFGVIRRTALEHHRRTKSLDRRAERFAAEEGRIEAPDHPERDLLRAEDGRALAAALELLSERQREVLHLVFYQDLTIAEAAEVMEVGLGSARTHYERGKARLRTLLQENEAHERPAAGQ
ncbi:MAG: RNA polymerase sigma factor [Gemmatimonadota bacterium]|nr:RNA polymerase sigma factor [Gemmatimonadota bacterium]